MRSTHGISGKPRNQRSLCTFRQQCSVQSITAPRGVHNAPNGTAAGGFPWPPVRPPASQRAAGIFNYACVIPPTRSRTWNLFCPLQKPWDYFYYQYSVESPPRRNRTSNHRLKRPLLYQLSYGRRFDRINFVVIPRNVKQFTLRP